MDDKLPKGSILQEDIEEQVEKPDYSPEEETYIKNLQAKLEKAKTLRSKPHAEFDGLTLTKYWQSNEKLANTELRELVNKQDVQYQSGTLRQKMMAFLASFIGLNLKPDITAYRADEIPVSGAGNAMEDILDKTEELENDEEKKMLRQYELLKHGTVFVEDIWEEQWKIEKKITKGFIGFIKGVVWKSKKLLGLGAPKRTILSLLDVYLGSMRKYFIEDQPYIFTVKTIPYSTAKSLYGEWERWEFVLKERRSFPSSDDAMINNKYRFLDELDDDQVEILQYQDKPNNEFQIIINGVPMLPMGYPLSEVHPEGEYTITQQNLEPIRADFAIGKSFIFKNKNLVYLLDEMMKLAVLKTQKSFLPPYLNLSGKLVSRRVFMPGVVTRGIGQGQLVPISDKEVQGVTASEANMIKEVKNDINANTASQTFTGQKEEGGNVTATQIVELQRQARVMMGMLILAATLLEKKLALKRIPLILANWFDPVDNTVDAIRGVIKSKYRIVSRPNSTDSGPGVRMTVLTENLPTSKQIKFKEKEMEREYGLPIRIIAVNPKEIKTAKLMWVVNVTAKEKKSSELSKLMFETMVMGAMNMGLRINPNYIEQRFADVWEEDPNKLFMMGQVQPQQPQQEGQGPEIKPPKIGVNTGTAVKQNAGILR